ncbi:Ankyrin repeat domain-containing protein 13C-A [Merluccius polli]|uniref:Ankyrin repeat domain-containing protein 13C-A n=1 Tax=Merluccius polli TaxID=89951 RepID=A0AA47NNB3_MERPO|nr:Ankyrin repeat domain-containing protein 13C-A [Merluccius polli]
MTGEKIRSLRKDRKPSKEGDLLEPDEEAATGTFTSTRTKSRASKIFSNHHKLVKSPSTQQQHQHHHHHQQHHHQHHQQSQVNANNTLPATGGMEVEEEMEEMMMMEEEEEVMVVDDDNKNPVLRADFPVHECVFKGDVRRLSSLIRTQNIAQKDVHGNTPLHLAVMMGNKECAHLLLAHNAPVKVKNAQGWSPLAEAISYGDRQMITALLRKLKHQSRETVEDKRPKLLTALKEVHVSLSRAFSFPLIGCLAGRLLLGASLGLPELGLDTTLIDFSDMKCQRGDLSFIFNGDAIPSESFVVLDNEQKVYQRIHHEESEMETEEEVDILMSSDVYSATLSTKSITFSRAQSGWLFREDKTERVGNFLADFYSVNGLVLESRKRREHLSEEDILRNKAIMESLSKGGNLIEQNFEPARRPSLTPPSPNTISWEEYITADNGKAPHLGRELVCKESKKNFKATVAMSQDFPLGIESLLNVLEVIAPFKHFNKLREFVQMKLPPGFPVKLDIPVFPTITATVTFQEFRYDEFEQSIFTIPSEYKEDPSRFPDL